MTGAMALMEAIHLLELFCLAAALAAQRES
jgi:hypothetical protein